MLCGTVRKSLSIKLNELISSVQCQSYLSLIFKHGEPPEWQTSDRIVCACSPWSLGWVARSHDTHPTNWETPIRFDYYGSGKSKSTAGERVKKRGIPTSQCAINRRWLIILTRQSVESMGELKRSLVGSDVFVITAEQWGAEVSDSRDSRNGENGGDFHPMVAQCLKKKTLWKYSLVDRTWQSAEGAFPGNKTWWIALLLALSALWCPIYYFPLKQPESATGAGAFSSIIKTTGTYSFAS